MSKQQQQQLFSRAEIGAMLGIGRASLDSFFLKPEAQRCIIRKGSNGQKFEIDLARFFETWVALKVAAANSKKATSAQDYDTAKASEKAAAAGLKQMELARLRGETVTVEQSRELWAQEIGMIKRNLSNLPEFVAIALRGFDKIGAEDVRQLIEDGLNASYQKIESESQDDDEEEDLNFG